jgi:hypothetical protein
MTQSKLAPCEQLFEANALQQLVSLLHSSNPTVAEVARPKIPFLACPHWRLLVPLGIGA